MKRKMKLPTILQVLTVIVAPIITYIAVKTIFTKPPSIVYANGNLTIEYNGTGPEDPVFVVSNMLPGDCETRLIKITNNSSHSINLSVWSDEEEKTPESFPDVLSMTITEGGILYQNTLSQFFSDSNVVGGVSLSPLAAGANTTYSFEICFDPGAGNEYQNAVVIFDLVFGQNFHHDIQIPPECSHIASSITNVIEGTNHDDRLRGTPASDLILGKGGKDKIDGKHGDDCIIGGDNDDDIEGGKNNDVILGGSGKDKLRGGADNDIIYGGEHDDNIDGGAEDDIVYGGSGNDKIKGSSGEDKLYGEEGNDDIDAGTKDDYANGGPGDDEIDGSTGEDTCLEGEDYNSCETIL